MNQKNLDYLKENLKYMGFSDRLYPDLQKNIEQGFPEFTLRQQTAYGKSDLESTLHFKKSEQSDLYFFNRHDASLKNENGPAREQSFYLNSKGQGITLKESFNLLEGRAVNTDLQNREGQKYNAWVQLDFSEKDQNGNFKMKQFHENYGYHLETALSKYTIKEMENPEQKDRILMSLQKGNIQSVTMKTGEGDQKMFISANPQFKGIHTFDQHLKPLSREQREGLELVPSLEKKENMAKSEAPAEKQDSSQKKMNKTAETSEEGSKKNKAKTVKDLLPQKQGSQKNGLAIS